MWLLATLALAPRTQPAMQLQFSATMRVSQTDQGPGGGPGDGCILARKLTDPIYSRLAFDAPAQRVAQSNINLERHPTKDLTVVQLYNLTTPMTLELEPFFNTTICYEKPLPPGASFGTWGSLNTFTGVLGMWYLKTSFLGKDDGGADMWQWMDVEPTLMPNGSTVNITRNYTYHLAAGPEPRALRRFEWTQGLPNGGDHSFRFCNVFDYTQDYHGGAPDASAFGPPPGTRCVNPNASVVF